VLIAMYAREGGVEPVPARARPALVAALVIAAVGTIVIGLFPQPYVSTANSAYASALGNARHSHIVLNH
jgi:NADH:ubiquinone oxidoreductase subunit 2 (subunit N)